MSVCLSVSCKIYSAKIMEDQNIYVIDDQVQNPEVTLNEPSDSGGVYMVLNAAQVKSSEYEDLQIGNTTTEVINKQVKDTTKTRAWITISIILTVLAVITFIALAIGSLGLRGSTGAQFVTMKETQNYTYLMEEISALKSLLVQINFETRENISQLDDRLSSSAMRLSNSADSAFSSISHLSYTSISQLSTMADQLSTSVSSVSTSVNQIYSSASISIRSLTTLVAGLRSTVSKISTSDIYSLSTSASELSTSIGTICTCPRG